MSKQKASTLPANTTQLMRALELSSKYKNDLAVNIEHAHHAFNSPSEFLPYLAYANSISEEEGWGFRAEEEDKRRLISSVFSIHSTKGTVHSIREIFRLLGLGEVEIIENVGRLFYDGQQSHDGNFLYGGDFSSTWATYSIKLFTPITISQANLIRRFLDGIAPARSELVSLIYTEVAHLHNNKISYDGNNSYGEH